MAISIPSFVLGSIVVYIFSSNSLGLSVSGYISPWEDLWGNLRNMILPALTLAVLASALIVRTTRDAIRSISSEPYTTAAVARGETASQIVRRHMLRNAAIPVLTVVATNTGYLLGGAVVIELIFALPGIGALALDAVHARDYGVVMAVTLLGTVIFVVLNLLVDMSYAVIDPRVGHRRGGHA
jgi:peptide/nickel transport system permease protein